MVKFTPKAIGLAATALFLAGCVDEKYDFDNYDGTTQIEVKDLILPLNLAPVTFESVVNIGDQDGIGYDAQGNYVLLKSDEFRSPEEIYINPLVARPDQTRFTSEDIPVAGVEGMEAVIDTESLARFAFDVSYDNVDPYIRAINSAEVDFTITLRVTNTLDCTYNYMRFRMPEGMSGTVVADYPFSFDPNEPNVVIFENIRQQDFSFEYRVNEITLQPENLQVSDGQPGIFSLQNSIALQQVDITANQTGSGVINAHFEISDIVVNTVTGRIMYSLDDFEEEAGLDDLPEELRDPQTRLGLRNPQLYLRVKNPVAKYGDVRAMTGLSIEQVRYSSTWLPQSTRLASVANPLTIAGVEGDQLFALAPQQPEQIYPAFAGAQWNPNYTLPGLDYIIYGEGLPDALRFRFTNPHMLESAVSKFPIGQSIGRISGEYAFYAPLDFTDGSQIVYTKDQTGWAVDMDEDLEISMLQITAHVESNIPVAVKFEAWPLEEDEYGNVRPNYNVHVEGAEIGPNETKDVVIKLVGNISHLEGMRYTVTLAAGADASTLNPDQKLSFTNLKVKVSGKYLMRDDDYVY